MICTICKKEYRANSNAQKRCVECQQLKCPICEKKFIPKTRNYGQKFCSRRCKAISISGVEPISLQQNRGKKPRTYHLKKRHKYGSIEDRLWRKSIFERDSYTCQNCRQRGGKLQAHHIVPYRESPELRHDLNNGITLCFDCHKKTETYGWSKYWHKKEN